MLVMAAGVVALLLVVANITLFSREVNNTATSRKQEYVKKLASGLESWYRINAAVIDTPGTTLPLSEVDLFKYSGLGRDFNAHISITSILDGGRVKYRQIAAWIPAPGEEDHSNFDSSGVFQPAFRETQYRIVSGQTIESQKFGETQQTMREVARLLELRSRALLMADPTHDVGVNYFRAMDCSNPAATEIKCTSVLGTAPHGFIAATSPALDLAGIAGVNAGTANDAWGRPIEINNAYVADPSNPEDKPPYVARIRSVPPWGEAGLSYSPAAPDNINIYISAVQMVN
jgi:hypothetical protein